MSGSESTKSRMESLRTSLPSLASARTRSESIENDLAGTVLIHYRYATDVVRECAEAWEKLITGKTQPGDVSM
jgi:hypothetical protein